MVAEAPILWTHDVKSRLIGKDPDAGKDWRQKEKGAEEDEMVGWHHLSVHMSPSKVREAVEDRRAVSAATHGASDSDTT